MIRIQEKQEEDFLLVHFSGSFELQDADQVETYFRSILQRTKYKVVLLFNQIDQLPATFMTPLLRLRNSLSDQGGVIILYELPYEFYFLLKFAKQTEGFDFRNENEK